MNITSYSFIFIFLPIVVVLYHFLNGKGLFNYGKLVLLAASLCFYWFLGWQGLVALLISLTICYLIATYIFTENNSIILKKVFLFIGIFLCIALLIYCKYLTYFESLINIYTGSSLTFAAIVVPVGISYFTFSQIAYLVDSYRDNSTKYSYLDYALFVSFFPKITVGPIAFAREMIPQFNDNAAKKLDYSNLSKGFYRFTLGLAKKLLIADNLGQFVDLGYLNIGNLGSTNSLLVIISYTLQIYFDFSGYCDLAIGICQMLGFTLCENFNSPYKALSIADFWKRWHMSLTRFFTQYVYIPLGGNRKGKVRTYINTLIIFLISGLWHGANTTFIVWGAIHGVGMVISKIIAPIMNKVPKIIRWLLTFSFVNLAWVFFRSPDIDSAIAMLKQLFTGGFIPINMTMVATCIPVEGQLIQWFVNNYASTYVYFTGSAILLFVMALGLYFSAISKSATERVNNFKTTRTQLFVIVILFVWSVLSLSQVSEFIYVNF